jgi:hypothetical protein
VTPHVAGVTEPSYEAMSSIVAEEVRCVSDRCVSTTIIACVLCADAHTLLARRTALAWTSFIFCAMLERPVKYKQLPWRLIRCLATLMVCACNAQAMALREGRDPGRRVNVQ